MSSDFLRKAAGAAKSVHAAQKSRAKLEEAAAARFARAEEAFAAARASYEKSRFEAALVEAAAWSELISELSVSADVAAQIVGVDTAHVKSVLSSVEKPPPAA